MLNSNFIQNSTIFGLSLFFTNTPSDLAEYLCSTENILGNAALGFSLKQFSTRP
jgi:hypothetical protein